MKLPSLVEVRKAVAAFSAVVVAAVGAGLITGQTAVYLSGLAAALLAGITTYLAPKNGQGPNPG